MILALKIIFYVMFAESWVNATKSLMMKITKLNLIQQSKKMDLQIMLKFNGNKAQKYRIKARVN